MGSVKRSAKITRREFVKGMTVGGAGLAATGMLAGCAQGPTPTPCPTPVGIPEKWDKEADVVVLGFGGAGAVTAVTVVEAGAKVIVLEKAPHTGGGASSISGGFITVTDPDKVEDAATYLYTACFGLTPKEVCRAWAEEIAKTPDWLTQHGIEFMKLTGPFGGADFKNFPGASALWSIDIVPPGEQVMNKGGRVFMEWAAEYLKGKGVEFLFGTPAKELIQHPETKEIIGVWAESGGNRIAVKAKKAVVLCTGGFEANEEMIGNFIRPAPIKCVGWPFNTGDGIKMAQKVGADIWHTNILAAAGLTFVPPNSVLGYWGMGFPGPSYIWVTRYGKRFTCENPSWTMHRAFMGFDIWNWKEDQTDPRYLAIPFYLIFDEKMRQAGPIYGPATVGPTTIPEGLGGLEPWSQDNTKEIEKGWIKKANTIAELAAAIGEPTLDPAVLEETIKRYNEYCANGEDPEFGRPKELAGMGAAQPSPNLVPLDTPPYYAMQMWPAVYSTCGGPRKNEKAQVLDPMGNPIPRLYEAGVIGHSAAHVYSTFGQNWAEIMAFGRIAGRNAAAEKPWS